MLKSDHINLLCRTVVVCMLAITFAQDIIADRLDVWQPNNYPTRLAEGPDGKIYVTDYYASSVFIYDSNLTLIGELRDPDRPLGIAVDRNGRIYVGNSTRKNIQVYDLDGNLLRSFGEGVIETPTDFVIDDEDNVYVADIKKNAILVFNPSGQHLGNISSSGAAPGRLKSPLSIALSTLINSNGQYKAEIYVGDQGNSRIQVFDRYGRYLRGFGAETTGGSQFGDADWQGKYEMIQSIQVDAAGNLHVLDSMMHKIQVIDPINGTMLRAYGDFGTAAGKINHPLDIIIRDNGSVIVANAGNKRIEIIGSNAVSQVTLSSNSLDENLTAGTIVGNLALAPPVGGSNSFMFVVGHGDTHNSYFNISGSNLLTSTELNYESISNYLIRISAVTTNSANLSQANQFTINLNDANDTPTNIVMDDYYIEEGIASNSLVGNFITLDPDAADSFSYWLTSGSGDGGNSSFSITDSNLFSSTVFNYDVTTNLSIRVVSQDSGGETATNVLNINIVNITQTGEWDVDGDGMADWWEWEHSTDGTKTNFMPDADNDGDGLINMYEWIASTDPEDDEDQFKIEPNDQTNQNDHAVLRWASYTNRVYSIEWTADFSLGFSNIVNNIDATPPMNVYTDATHSADSSGFYKIKVQLKP